MLTTRPKRISVIGAGTCDDLVRAQAREVGFLAAQRGFAIVCGGLGGVMAGACQGAREAGGLTIGILPGDDPGEANPFVDVPVATGFGIARNVLVVKNGLAVIAIAGGAGTLSEIGVALKLQRPVVALGHYGTLADVTPAQTPEEAVAKIAALLGDR